MNKDTYTVLRNPKNIFTPFEVWVKVEEKYVSTEDGSMKARPVVKKIDNFRTEQKAKDVIRYWTELQSFKKENM